MVVAVVIGVLSMAPIILLGWIRYHLRPKRHGIMAVMGSGGHTTEIIRLLKHLDDDLQPTSFLLGHDDRLSADKLHACLQLKAPHMFFCSRPRRVGQSYLSSVLTTANTFFECCQFFAESIPQVVDQSVNECHTHLY